jgi:hypothetical protein
VVRQFAYIHGTTIEKDFTNSKGEKRRVSSSKLEGTLAPFAKMGFEGGVAPFVDICKYLQL